MYCFIVEGPVVTHNYFVVIGHITTYKSFVAIISVEKNHSNMASQTN
jgi:hypothetical protein